jgi:hypothetical protein
VTIAVQSPAGVKEHSGPPSSIRTARQECQSINQYSLPDYLETILVGFFFNSFPREAYELNDIAVTGK